MKSLIVSSVVLISFFLVGCSKNSVDPRSEVFNKLKGEWKVESAMLDDQIITDYDEFALLFSNSTSANVYTYSCTNRPSLGPWAVEGTWQFGENFEEEILRDEGTEDELRIAYSLTQEQLVLSFIYAGGGYTSRTASTNGEWVFTFSR